MLNARKVEAAKGKEKSYKLSDGGGLYLQVEPNGSRYWRMKSVLLAAKQKQYSEYSGRVMFHSRHDFGCK